MRFDKRQNDSMSPHYLCFFFLVSNDQNVLINKTSIIKNTSSPCLINRITASHLQSCAVNRITSTIYSSVPEHSNLHLIAAPSKTKTWEKFTEISMLESTKRSGSGTHPHLIKHKMYRIQLNIKWKQKKVAIIKSKFKHKWYFHYNFQDKEWKE